MESITKDDLRDLFAELRCEVKRSIAEGFATWKPAVKARNTGQQHDYRDRRNGAADPLNPSVLQASTTPITTAEEPLAVDPVLSISTISVAPSTCSTECPNYDTAGLALAAASTSPTATVDSTSVSAAAGHGMLDCKPVNGATSAAEGSLVTGVVPNNTTAVVHALCSAEGVTMLSPMPATTAPTLLRTSPSECITNFRGHGRLLRPMPWPSFRAGELTATENRPRPWPSLMDVHVDGVEARPLPWPSFGKINGCEFPSDVVEKAFRRCISDSSSATLCDVIKFSVTDLYSMVRRLELKLMSIGSTFITISTVLVDSGNLAASSCEYLGDVIVDCAGSWLFAGCSVAICKEPSIQMSTNYFMARETAFRVLSTVDLHLLDFPCRSPVAICWHFPQEAEHYFCCSQPKESPVLNSMRRSGSSYDQLSCAIQDASYWAGYFITRSRMNLLFTTAIRCSDWLASCVCDDPTTILLFAVLWDELVLQPWNSRQQDVSYAQFPCVNQDASGWLGYFFTGVLIHKQHSKLLYALSSPFVVLYDEWVLPLWDPGPEVFLSDLNKISWSQAIHDILLKKLMVQSLYFEHTLLAPHMSRLAAQDICTKFPICESSGKSCCCGILCLDWHMTIILTDSGSTFPATVVLSIAKCCGNWQRVYSAIGRGALLLIRSAALKYMELWWFATVLDTKIMGILSDGFSMQEDVTCSVQPTTVLHAYQHSNFGWEQFVWIAHSFAWGDLPCLQNSETTVYTLLAASSEMMFMVEFGGEQGTSQRGRHMPATDRNKGLRLLWDPGGATAAWGQAAFQGGRGVRDPPYTSTHRHGLTPRHGLGPPIRSQRHGNYKYATYRNEEDIQVGSGKWHRRLLPSHLGSDSPFPFLLVHPVSKSSTESL